jgi:hypothetical protein
MKRGLIVSAATDISTGKPTVNRCQGCQNSKEQEEELHEEEPLMLTGFNPQKKTDNEEKEFNEEQPLIPPHKY